MPVCRNLILALSIYISGCLLSGCTLLDDRRTTTPIHIDFTAKPRTGGTDTLPPASLKVAISSMISPKETFTYYEALMRFVSARLGVPVEMKQRKTYQEVNDMLVDGQIELAFICSGAYVESPLNSRVEILAVPVVHGEPTYRAYVIVHENYSAQTFADLKGVSFAFTDPLSNTGYTYAVKRVKQLGSSVETFFSKTLFTHAHDYSIQLVVRGIVDAATVDGLIFEYLMQFTPDKVRGIRVLEKSAPFGIPPVVVPRSLPDSTKERLRQIFFSLDEDATGKGILRKLMIDRFVPGRDEDYNSVRTIKRFTGQ